MVTYNEIKFQYTSNNITYSYTYYPTAGTITFNNIYSYLSQNNITSLSIFDTIRISISSSSFTFESYLFSPNNTNANNSNKKFTRLKNVYLNNLNFLSNYCFYNITSLETVYFLNTNITNINSYCFSGCTSLKNLYKDINGTNYNFQYIITIGNNALENTKLTSLTISSTVTSIGNNCFKGMNMLTDIYFENSLLNNIIIDNNIIDQNKNVTIHLNMTKAQLLALDPTSNNIRKYHNFITGL